MLALITISRVPGGVEARIDTESGPMIRFATTTSCALYGLLKRLRLERHEVTVVEEA